MHYEFKHHQGHREPVFFLSFDTAEEYEELVGSLRGLSKFFAAVERENGQNMCVSARLSRIADDFVDRCMDPYDASDGHVCSTYLEAHDVLVCLRTLCEVCSSRLVEACNSLVDGYDKMLEECETRNKTYRKSLELYGALVDYYEERVELDAKNIKRYEDCIDLYKKSVGLAQKSVELVAGETSASVVESACRVIRALPGDDEQVEWCE